MQHGMKGEEMEIMEEKINVQIAALQRVKTEKKRSKIQLVTETYVKFNFSAGTRAWYGLSGL